MYYTSFSFNIMKLRIELVDNVLQHMSSCDQFLHSNPNICTNQLERYSYLFYPKQFQNSKVYKTCAFQILKMFLFFSCRKYINWFNLILVSYLSSNAAFHFKYKRWNTGTQTIKEAIFFYHATQHATHPEYVIVLLLLLVRVFADPCSCNTFKVLGCQLYI